MARGPHFPRHIVLTKKRQYRHGLLNAPAHSPLPEALTREAAMSADLERVFRVSMNRAGANAQAVVNRCAKRIAALALPEGAAFEQRGYTSGGQSLVRAEYRIDRLIRHE